MPIHLEWLGEIIPHEDDAITIDATRCAPEMAYYYGFFIDGQPDGGLAVVCPDVGLGVIRRGDDDARWYHLPPDTSDKWALVERALNGKLTEL